jgi:hypothetical protein
MKNNDNVLLPKKPFHLTELEPFTYTNWADAGECAEYFTNVVASGK